MNRKAFIWGGLFIGSSIGGLVPNLWGSGMFSMGTVILSGVGGVIGVFVGFKIATLIGL